MEKGRRGFDYYLSDEAIKNYLEKSPELRLKWLYMGNLLRKRYPKGIIKLHNKLRRGMMGRIKRL